MENKSTLLKLKEKEREFRRALIIEAAREVFGRKTYDQASMAEIAKSAGIGKSSIYTYFKNQEDLYAQIASEDVQVFIEQLRTQIEKETDPIEAVIRYFLEYYTQNESQWRMVTHFALHAVSGSPAVEELNAAGRELMDVLESVFVTRDPTEKTRLMAHTLFSCLSGILIAFRNYPGRSEADRIRHMQKIGENIKSLLLKA